MAKSDPFGCPFCGSYEVEICRTNPNACWVRCGTCGADAKSHRTRAGAIANWNRRSDTTRATASIVSDDDRDYNIAREAVSAADSGTYPKEK